MTTNQASIIDIEDTQRRQLVEGVRKGRYSLLIGAGLSTCASGEDGRMLPTGRELAEELAIEFDLPKGYTLSRLWGALPPGAREEYLVQRFSNSQVDRELLPIHRFVWQTIWNLNVDDVVENLYADNNAAQTLEVLTFQSRYKCRESLSDLLCVHLHGCVSYPDAGYVFSTQDYGRLTANTPVWGSILADELATKPFIAIGTSLDEYDLEHFLELRTGLDASRQPLPSLLVVPESDLVLSATASRYGLLPLASTADAFLRELYRISQPLISPLDLTVPAQIAEIYSRTPSSSGQRVFHRQFLYVKKSELPEPDSPSNFLRGMEPTWHDIINDHDVIRQDQHRLSSMFCG